MTVIAVDADTSKAITILDRPKDCLSDDPKIETVDDVNRALREMAFLAAHTEAVNARRDKAVEELNAQFDAELRTSGPKGQISYRDRETLLLNAVEKFAGEEYPTARDAESKRTVKLADGTIKWTKIRDRLNYLENHSDKTTLSIIDKGVYDADDRELGLMQRVNNLLQKTKVKVTIGPKDKRVERFVPLAAVVKLQPAIEKNRLHEALQSKVIDEEILQALGLMLETGGDYFEAKPNKYVGPDAG